MKIAILSKNRFEYCNRRLREESKRRDYKLMTYNPTEFDMVLQSPSPLMFKEGKSIGDLDYVIPRMGASINNYGLAVVAQFKAMGIPLLNGLEAVSLTRNKLSCIQALSQRGIGIPKTVVVRQPGELTNAIGAVGGFPTVLKLISGTQGMGVMLAEDKASIQSTLDTLWSLGQDILIQECIKESLGRDIRAFVLGGKVVAAMRRQARIGEFRNNLNRGGVTTNIEVTPEIEKAAVDAAQSVGLEMAGVDLLESKSGLYTIELNASPSFEAMEGTSGLNIAEKILDRIEELKK